MRKLYPLIFGLITFCTHAQNLEQLGVKQGIKANGSINLNAVGYYVDGIEQRRDPFNWFATGNLNLNLFGYSTPFSFSYSNANTNFSQPFNQFSFQPQYKWVKTYIGYNAMTFSKYTLAGHVFLGGGVDLSPGKWRISAMYGRLRKAVPFDLNDTLQNFNASFKRMGYGLKIGYEDNGDIVSANIFAAKDDVNSIPFVLSDVPLAPQQNVAVGFHVRKQFLKRLFVEAEYTVSAMNKDTRASSGEQDTVDIVPTNNIIKNLLPENATSRYYDALNASLGYQGSWYSVQLKYERIAPEYETLGAYFFNNDMRNITIAPSVRLLNNKLTLAVNAGFQENNLDETRESTTQRVVGSCNINYLPNERWNLTMGYSNFSSFTNIRPQQDPFFRNTLDTLNFFQVSQTMNGSVMRNFGAKEKAQSVMLNLSYQKANDNASYEGGDQQSDFINANASYSFSLTPSGTTLALAANVYETNAAGIRSTYWGPTVSVTKAFMEKRLRASWASSYNETSGNVPSSPVMNNRLNISYVPASGRAGGNSPHNFSIGINVLNRLKEVEQQPAYTELTGTFNYGYTF